MKYSDLNIHLPRPMTDAYWPTSIGQFRPCIKTCHSVIAQYYALQPSLSLTDGLYALILMI